MSGKTLHVQLDVIEDLIGTDLDNRREFCEAAIISFKQFSDEYITYMNARDICRLRDAGHRIKPVAQMLGVNILVAEYEKAKKLLANEAPDEDIKASIHEVKEICNMIIVDFKRKMDTK